MTRICVFASGNGSNFQSIYNSTKLDNYNAEVVLFISNNSSCNAIEFARENNIRTKLINKGSKSEDILKFLIIYKIDLILLAGYLKKIPNKIIENFPNKIMNIHPALLPKYGGKGYFGMRVHEAVIASGDENTGVTVHFVNKNYDEGPIVIQKVIPVLCNDNAQTLAARVLIEEHKIYPKILRAFCENRIIWKDNKPEILKK